MYTAFLTMYLLTKNEHLANVVQIYHISCCGILQIQLQSVT